MSRLLIEAQKIIQINSMSYTGNEELTNYLVSLFQEAGIEYKVQHVTHAMDDVSKRQFNLIGIIGDPLVDRKTKKGLLLLSHLDTVGSGHKEYWTETNRSPLSGEIKNEKLYGLGAASKIDFICKLFAAKKMKEQKQKMPIYLAGVCGSTLGMFGTRYLIQSQALNPRYICVGSPTGGRIGKSHPASGTYKIQIHFQTVEKDARGFSRGMKIYFNGKQGAPHLANKNHAIENMLDLFSESLQRGYEIRFKEFLGGEYPQLVPDAAQGTLFLTSHQFEDYKRFLRDKEKQNASDSSRQSLLPQFKVEYGALGESGVSFLPDVLFSCVQKIRNELTHLQNEKLKSQQGTINFGKLECKNNKMNLYFEVNLQGDIRQVDSYIKEILEEASNEYPKLNVSLTKDKPILAYENNSDSRLYHVTKELAQSFQLPSDEARTYIPNSASFYSSNGDESVFFGFAEGDQNFFEPNEFISEAKIQMAYEYYLKLIERICL